MSPHRSDSGRRQPVNARYDQLLLKRVDDWRRRQPKIPARSEALRELVRRALNAEEQPA